MPAMPMRVPRRFCCRHVVVVLVLSLAVSYPAAVVGATPAQAAPVAVQFCRTSCSERYLLQVADTARAHARGLMGVVSLPPRGGMLFVFARPERRVFWMKDTPLALDLVFVGSNCRVVGIVHHAVPFDERELSVEHDSQYVVELAAGSAAAAGLRAGDAVRFATEAGRCGPPVARPDSPAKAPERGALAFEPGPAASARPAPAPPPRPGAPRTVR